MRRSRILKGIAVAVVAVLVLGVVGFLWYAQPQPLLPEATAALASTPGATFEEGSDGRLTYMPTAAPPTTGLILYPGGKVPPAAYAPAARAIAEQGYLVVDRPGPVQPRGLRHRCGGSGHRRPSGDRDAGRSAGTRSAARWPPSSSTRTPARRRARAVGVVLGRGHRRAGPRCRLDLRIARQRGGVVLEPGQRGQAR